MSDLRKKVGRRIKEIREANNIKQCVLAEMLSMEPSNLTRIENGYQFPKEENLEKIAKVLNVEIKDLFDFTPNFSFEILQKKLTALVCDLSYNEMKFVYKLLKLYKING